MNENKLTREEAIVHALSMEEEINRKVTTQYIGMLRQVTKIVLKTFENQGFFQNPT